MILKLIKNMLPMILAYGAIRVSSYMTDPRPYLWWHLVLDLVVLSMFTFFQFLRIKPSY